ncbi:MAG: hypothetical protein K0R03_388 [Moraxellaceae bacterium]|jgi:hypothetical protein|nr:hypothetical protein [Moraxellaceae bacterium]
MKAFAAALLLILALPAHALEAADDSALSDAAGDAAAPRSGCDQVAEANIGKEPRIRPEVLSEKSIARTFEVHAAELHQPYLRARHTDACLQGSLLFRITVNGNGSVTALSYRASNQAIARLGEQLATLINGIRFEPPGRSDTFEHMVSLFGDMDPE